MKARFRQLSILLLLMLLMPLFHSVRVAAADDTGQDGVYGSLAELEEKRIGVKQGSIYDALVSERFPACELSYYLTESDMLSALKSGRIDAFAAEIPAIRLLMQSDDALTYVNEPLNASDFGFIFPKTDAGRALNEEFSTFIREIKADGTLDEILETWMGTEESAKVLPDYTAFPGENGTLTLATSGQVEPSSYVKNGQTVGFDLAIASRFCEDYGYRLNVQMMDFSGILASVETGKCDFGGSSISITPERAESMVFSEPYFTSGAYLAVLKKTVAEGSFLSSLGESFEKTFLREDRYKLFLEGIGTTFLITILAVLSGTALGFGMFLACRRGNPVANLLARFFVWLIRGMPVVVLLMILYYVIFAKSAVSGTIVAVIAFTLVFGVGVFGMLQSGVGVVDRGQTEGALSLGYSERRTFFRVILPQAVPHMLPAYKSEIVALIKATAVVGYIAVQDLTKMADIVRSRTYEAFFPLIAVAVLYFIMAAMLIFFVNRIELRTDPKKRKKEAILAGIDTTRKMTSSD